MKRKARIQTGIDDRLVAIYARKSRITNKGDSIGVQFKQSADYAINQLSLPEDYEFARYEDKGLSGYYSDRPDFQRLLRDIEMGKIKAVACYKLDRISRKTSDLMRLLEYFERHDVTLLVCSNNINTRISTSKIIIQVLAIIAEFERDILTERIQDNLMELDEFVIHSLSSLQEEHSDYYRQLLENRVASMIRTDQSEKEYQETKKAIERLNADIAAQVRNLREADDALKRFIQDDIKELTDELAKREAALRRMEDTQSENQYLIHELNGMKKRLLSFEEFAKGAQPEALFTLVHSIVDRIYITTDGTKQKCQVYIKGCATEDYSDVLGAAGYIEEEPLLPVASYVPPMCDLDYYSIGDLSIDITSKSVDYMKKAGFWSESENSLTLLDHLTFEKIHE